MSLAIRDGIIADVQCGRSSFEIFWCVRNFQRSGFEFIWFERLPIDPKTIGCLVVEVKADTKAGAEGGFRKLCLQSVLRSVLGKGEGGQNDEEQKAFSHRC